jgi:hypothetical protein
MTCCKVPRSQVTSALQHVSKPHGTSFFLWVQLLQQQLLESGVSSSGLRSPALSSCSAMDHCIATVFVLLAASLVCTCDLSQLQEWRKATRQGHSDSDSDRTEGSPAAAGRSWSYRVGELLYP